MNILGNANNLANITNNNLHRTIKDAIDKIGNGGELNYIDAINSFDRFLISNECKDSDKRIYLFINCTKARI